MPIWKPSSKALLEERVNSGVAKVKTSTSVILDSTSSICLRCIAMNICNLSDNCSFSNWPYVRKARHDVIISLQAYLRPRISLIFLAAQTLSTFNPKKKPSSGWHTAAYWFQRSGRSGIQLELLVTTLPKLFCLIYYKIAATLDNICDITRKFE